MITVYALVDPRTSQARYVGQTTDPRLRFYGHITNGDVKKPAPWILELLECGMYPEMVTLEEGIPKNEWEESERFWIGYLKALGADLVNIHGGGAVFMRRKEGTMSLSEAQWRALKKLAEAHPKGCEYVEIMQVHANGMTLQSLADKGLIDMRKTFGTKFWYITADGLKRLH